MNNKTKLCIKDLAEEDRPREKMLLKGVSALTDAELLGILIGSGNRKETAVELAQRILYHASNNLNTLGKQEINQLIKNFEGIGEAKAITIVAALELGKRRKLSEIVSQPQIMSSHNVFNLLHPVLGDLKHEEVWVLLLNKSNKVLKKMQLSKGGIAGTVVDIRMIMKEALDSLASSLILCHNHPSGNTNPSGDDDEITFKLREAGNLMDIKLLDHIIISDNGFYSYLDKGRF